MIKAAFVTQHESWPWTRQLRQGSLPFDGVSFFAPVEEAEIVFVYDALPSENLTVHGAALTVFVCSEPQNVKRYNAGFLAQFDAVITTDWQTPHPNRIFTQAGLPWHVGSMSAGGVLLGAPMTFEEFENHDPVKERLVSVVSSDKAFTPEHRARLAFVSKLKEALGDQVDVFGRGIADFADKRDVLDAYRYHIALENCAFPDYWTEKLADPYLTLTFPIYHGTPNVVDYFPADSLRQINIYEPDKAVEIIRNVIASDLAEQNRSHLLEARRRVMHEHNLFGLLASVSKSQLAKARPKQSQSARTIKAEAAFQSPEDKATRLIRRIIKAKPLAKLARRVRGLLR